MRKLWRFFAQEDGIALATVVMMTSVLTVLSITLIDQVTRESGQAASAVSADAVYQAAEAGINDYIAKLVEDPQFYDHYVANGESTRQQCTSFNSSGGCTAPGTVVGPGSEWTSGIGWTYPVTADAPEGKSTWYAGAGSTSIGNYAYNLIIAPPSSPNNRKYVTVVSTGCRVVDPNATPLICSTSVLQRAIEVHLATTTPADFSFMFGETPTYPYGQTADTYGRIYSLGDLCHDGTAHGDLMAEGRINRSGCNNGGNASVTMVSPAQKYDSSTTPRASCPAGSTLPCPLKSAVQFTNFSTSLTDIKRAADLNSPTTDFDQSGYTWKIMFGAGSGTSGTVRVWRCANNSSPAASAPSGCGTTPVYNNPLPKNGAIFTGQTAIIYYAAGTDAVVNGRATVASNNDIVIGSNIHYNSESAYGGANDDVLGLIAYRNVWVAAFAPDQLFWRAAVIAENGMESVWDCTNPPRNRVRTANSKMTIVGSIASADGSGCALYGNIGGYDTRVYASDDGSYTSEFNALKFLFPPWYPVIDTQATSLFREVPTTYVPPTS
jgi:Tfp pilus assembly protein PilX